MDLKAAGAIFKLGQAVFVKHNFEQGFQFHNLFHRDDPTAFASHAKLNS
jgi:hypothetical protein